MSAPVQGNGNGGKRSIAAKLIRAFFIGNTIGILGGLGIYLMATAINTLSSSSALNPLALLLLTYGVSVMAAEGVELSKDLAES